MSIIETKLERRRIRLISALGDFQLASSASAFLAEVDVAERYSTKQLRRFRCYETSLIIAYTRPFTQTKGTVPRLSIKMTNAKLTQEQSSLHGRVMELRNKITAHTDEEMMRFATTTFPLDQDNGTDFHFLQMEFDEGLTFIGNELWEFDTLLRTVSAATYRTLLEQVQANPAAFRIRKNAD
ncbi:MAG: hypothetical protein ACOY4O_16730 [Pseudomonadota bacterium]